MIAQEIVDRLAADIPRFTTAFSTSLAINSIIVSGGGSTATVSVVAHGIAENQSVSINGALAPVQIDTGTFLRTLDQATFETLQDHDFTLSQRDIAGGGKTITISGAVESEFNGDFMLIKVVNRRRLIIAVADSGPTTISGSPIIEDANGGIFNGLFTAINVTTNAFQYALPVSYPLNAVVDNATVQTSIRVLSVLDVEQYVNDVYTKKDIDEDVLVVQLGDVVQSKARNEESDASTSTSGEYSYTPLLIQGFAVYILQNVTDDLTGAKARDRVETEFVPAIFRALLRAQLSTGFTYSPYRCTFTGHGVFGYADVVGKNKAIYVHEITFELLAPITRIEMVGPDADVAMRDVCYTFATDIGTGEMTGNVDLDEEPIP